jgi:hypothetical protein
MDRLGALTHDHDDNAKAGPSGPGENHDGRPSHTTKAFLGTIPHEAGSGLARETCLRHRTPPQQDARMTPQPISTAPEEDDKPILLFCPEQGGWHTGVWFRGKWLAYIDMSVVLRPSH